MKKITSKIFCSKIIFFFDQPFLHFMFAGSVISVIFLAVFYKEENKRDRENSLRISFRSTPQESRRESNIAPLGGGLSSITGLESNPNLASLRARRCSLPNLIRDDDLRSHESLALSDDTRTEIVYSSRSESETEGD